MNSQLLLYGVFETDSGMPPIAVSNFENHLFPAQTGQPPKKQPNQSDSKEQGKFSKKVFDAKLAQPMTTRTKVSLKTFNNAQHEDLTLKQQD